jgi:hypothetical protein
MFLKDQWKDWARAWGLAHQPEKGWIYRTERVLGERKGLLFRVGWGRDESPGLNTCVRFPRVSDPERLRQALIEDPTLDTLPGSGAARRKMAIHNDGPKKVIRIGHDSEFTLTPDRLVWRRTFGWSAPKVAQVQEWADTLVAAVARATPVFDGRCETCGTGVARHYVVADDLPTMMCGTCQQRLRAEGEMAERTYDMIEVRHLNGALLALGAVVAGAVVWAALGALTQRIYSVVAIGIGALVAWTYRKAAGRVDHAGRAIAAGLTALSVVLGEIMLYAWWVAQANPGVGFRLDAGWSVYARTWAEAPRDEIFTLLCALAGAWVAIQALQRPKIRVNIETAESQVAEQRKAA